MNIRPCRTILGTAMLLTWAIGAHAGAGKAYILEEGISSWYGAQFQGRPTASGERFDKGEMTAAHRTLPFGTVLLVTNLDNGRQARLRVNDRGPFVGGRVLDCAEAGAEVLGFRLAGTAQVRLEVLGALPEADDPRLSRKQQHRLRKQIERARQRGRTLPDEVLVPVDAGAGFFLVQVGAFAVKDNALRLAQSLTGQGFASQVVMLPDGLHRVRVGPQRGRAAADAVALKLQAAGQSTFVLRDDTAGAEAAHLLR